MNKYPIQKVKCPSCRRIYYQTNEKYDPEKPLKGYMLDLVKPYNQRDWGKFDGQLSDDVSQMLCIGCGAPLAPGGKLIFADELTCPICGKVCKTRLGLSSHMRSHK